MRNVHVFKSPAVRNEFTIQKENEKGDIERGAAGFNTFNQNDMQIKLGRAKRREAGNEKKKVISAENTGSFETHNYSMRGENVGKKKRNTN